MLDPDCVFCQIVAREADASVVFEDAHVLGFLDTQPATLGHVLIIPKTHSVGLADLDERSGAAMLAAARIVARALRTSSVPCDGVNLFFADGEAAFQEVFHSHLHVIPRRRGDGFRVDAAWTRPSRRELDEIAARIAAQVT